MGAVWLAVGAVPGDAGAAIGGGLDGGDADGWAGGAETGGAPVLAGEAAAKTRIGPGLFSAIEAGADSCACPCDGDVCAGAAIVVCGGGDAPALMAGAGRARVPVAGRLDSGEGGVAGSAWTVEENDACGAKESRAGKGAGEGDGMGGCEETRISAWDAAMRVWAVFVTAFLSVAGMAASVTAAAAGFAVPDGLLR